MRFKNILCLTKVSKNQTQTERTENTIIFNTSKIEILDGILKADIQDREILYIASSHSEKQRDAQGKVHYRVDKNWVNCFKKGETDFILPSDTTDILFITKEIYANMHLSGYSDEDIYLEFKKQGLGYMSNTLSNVEDFSVLTALIVE
jgi:hypothetical protein